MRALPCLVYAALLAAAIHSDWHLSRPGHHGGMSGDWALHWVIAVPVFALIAWLVSREPAATRWRAAACIIVGGVVAGQLLEPLFEVLTDGVGWSWMLLDIRWTAFAEFMATGFVTFLLGMAWKSQSVEGPPNGG